MTTAATLRQEAIALPMDERKRILESIPETEFHEYLAQLFREMSSEYLVAVTHGANELGKDLVIIREDPLAPLVIAVVVKRGDIRARTAGESDEISQCVTALLDAKGKRATQEIVSQVRQSLSHPAELRTHIERLEVTKVLVVLVGSISANVRTRLERELDERAQLFDVAWLIARFTEAYPQIFFDGRAVDFLDGLICRLEDDTFYAKAGKTLSQCFVEPIIAPLDRNIAVNDTGLAIQMIKRRMRLSGLMTLLAKKARILLVGDPGSGKSKALAKLCIDRYRAALRLLTHSRTPGVAIDIPCLVTVHQVEECASAQALLDEILPVATRERFRLGALLVDGLDEVPANRRAALMAKCRQFSDQLACGLLLTSRKLASLSTAPDGFQRYELLPFELGQALKLVEKALADMATLPALRDGLRRVSNQIPMSPLSLLLLVEVVTERKEVPSSITELYDRFLDLVFGRWDQEKGLEVIFEYLVKKRFLARLAYELCFVCKRLEIPADEFVAFGERFAQEFGWDPDRFREFLKEIERAAILDVHEEVVFRHRSFLDYFVALYLHENRTTFTNIHEDVTQIYFDAMWSEVAFFYAGLGREVAPDLMTRIFAHSAGDDACVIEKALAGRLLQAGWFSPTALKKEYLRQCLAVLPEAGALFQRLLKENELEVPLLYADMFVVLLAEWSVGSITLSGEGSSLLEEYRRKGATVEGTLLERMALLWAARRYLPPDEHREQMLGYVRDVQGMQLAPMTEARFLLLATLADGANRPVAQAVVKRMRRLKHRAPGLLSALVPVAKHGFRRKARATKKK